ncbi:MAG: CBS domain-containing protein [Maricaulaceae bacterium]|jgi:CBS domain-containing protein
MNVAAILSDKGATVHTIAPSVPVREAARMLDEKGVGALVVVEGAVVCGVLSERDIAREVARNGAEALDRPLSGAMTKDVVTAAPGDTLDQLLSRMTSRRIRHLPVIVDGALSGLVSIGDVVKWKIKEAEDENRAMRDYITTG